MNSDQILWAVNTLLLAAVGVLIRGWMANIKEALEKIDKRLVNIENEKLSVSLYDKLHDELKKRAHSHGKGGNAGEVIPQ